jgi:hypothetical protein
MVDLLIKLACFVKKEIMFVALKAADLKKEAQGVFQNTLLGEFHGTFHESSLTKDSFC